MSLDNVGLSTLDLTLAKGMRPKACANKIFAAYPEAASLNYSYRPNTALVGTSPFMALGGPPSLFMATSNQLRPQSTIMANGPLTSAVRVNMNSNTSCMMPLQTRPCNPVSSIALMKNLAYDQVYLNKTLL